MKHFIQQNVNSALLKSSIGLLLLVLSMQQGFTQEECVQCNGTTTSGTYPSAIGSFTSATGDYSFSGGLYSSAAGGISFAFGNRAMVEGTSSVALGQFVRATSLTSMTIGAGFDINNPLINNNLFSMMIGFGSTKPTFFVGTSPSSVTTGRIGIGDITAPEAKLHIKADAGEPATLRLEATGTSGDNVFSRMLFTPNHSIQAADNQNFTFSTQSTKHFVFQNGNVGIGVTNPQKALDVQGDVRASGSFFIGDDPIRSSQWENFESDVFYNQGNVGIGTNATNGYKLAVAGKIIAQEMRIVHTVPESDYVFKPDYPLMPLNELKAFISTNNHLPEVPSAAYFKENGYSVGIMDDLLLRKIEELTLYILQQQVEIERLKEIVESNP